ncbi:hypothetical protein CDIMF43_110032 [Carnobacterium divergens]|nr:hypothetical protein CDIMF43_110032 [Carnobacterium divergens]
MNNEWRKEATVSWLLLFYIQKTSKAPILMNGAKGSFLFSEYGFLLLIIKNAMIANKQLMIMAVKIP